MARTIRNPIEWGADQLIGAVEYVAEAGDRLAVHADDPASEFPRVRRIRVGDLREVLQKGIEDFAACRTDVAFLCIVYPIIGICLTWFAFDRDLVPLLFPAISGFALLGPVAAIGMYEMSRRRELGEEASWVDAIRVVSSPSFGPILVLAVMLLAVFGIWMLTAQAIYSLTLGPEPPESLSAFIGDVLTTGAGWAMIIVGIAVGFLFAALVLATSVVSFPLLLDRKIGLPVAVITSVRVTALNLPAIATWGLIVAGSLAVASIPVFLGLILVLPVLGHATWHLYRRVVVPEAGKVNPVGSAG